MTTDCGQDGKRRMPIDHRDVIELLTHFNELHKLVNEVCKHGGPHTTATRALSDSFCARLLRATRRYPGEFVETTIKVKHPPSG